jgi:aminopeptidase N
MYVFTPQSLTPALLALHRSGNRVTCRDWFQLTLKEGLTVFRDQHFSSDMTSEAVKRIEDVRIMRSAQFLQVRGSKGGVGAKSVVVLEPS